MPKSSRRSWTANWSTSGGHERKTLAIGAYVTHGGASRFHSLPLAGEGGGFSRRVKGRAYQTAHSCKQGRRTDLQTSAGSPHSAPAGSALSRKALVSTQPIQRLCK